LSGITWISLPRGLIDHNVGDEGNESGRGMPRSRFAEHLTSLGVEGGVRRQGAVTKSTPNRAVRRARGQRQKRILAIQGLDGGLFIPAEHRGMRRRIQIHPIMSAAFFSKSGSFEAM
jgi:hypothetical protein